MQMQQELQKQIDEKNIKKQLEKDRNRREEEMLE